MRIHGSAAPALFLFFLLGVRAAAAEPVQPPASFAWPDGFAAVTDGGVRQVDFGRDEWQWPEGKPERQRREVIEGRFWVLIGRAQPRVAPPLDEAACFSRLRDRLAPLGWKYISRAPYTVLRREEGGVEGFLQITGNSDHLVVRIAERAAAPPRSLALPSPAAQPETWRDGEAPPWLPPYPESKLITATVRAGTFEWAEAGRERTWVGNPMLRLEWRGSSRVSAHEVCAVLGPALQRAGWQLLPIRGCAGYQGDGVIQARWVKDGRDLYLAIHALGETMTADVADLAMSAAARRLKEALAHDGHVAVYGIYFDVDKDVLKPESEATLRQILALLTDDRALGLGIEGHTDSTGERAHNQRLSEARAASVKRWLVEKGVAAARLTTAGFADTRPVEDNKSPEGRSKNRRVELVRK